MHTNSYRTLFFSPLVALALLISAFSLNVQTASAETLSSSNSFSHNLQSIIQTRICDRFAEIHLKFPFFPLPSYCKTIPHQSTVTISASPLLITAGQSSILSWASSNATSCSASDGWSGSKTLSGSESISPATTTTYVITCMNTTGSATSSVKITVTPVVLQPGLAFSGNPLTIIAGSSTSLTWSSSNTASCFASGGWNGARGTAGSEAVSPSATSDFGLTCTGPGGIISGTTTITVLPAPQPTVNLSATPLSIQVGSTSVLTWTSSNATSCVASESWSGAKALASSLLVTPATTSVYVLACTGLGGTAHATTTVTVTPLPSPQPIVTLVASPLSITNGASSTLTWSSTGASTCAASGGWSGAQSISGTLTVFPATTTTYTLSCSNVSGTATTSTTVNVTAAPVPTLTFSGSPSTITNGGTSTLSWTSNNTTSCTASVGWSGSKPTSGIQVVSPATTTIYVLVCSGLGGNITATTTISFVPTTAPTVSLVANPLNILSGGTSTLTWSSTNATSCVASQGWSGSKITAGTQNVSPLATTTYVLDCVGLGGSAQATTTVGVSAATSAPPTLTLSASPSTIVNGASSTLTWSSTNATACTASQGWSGARNIAGGFSVSPSTTTVYVLNCSGAGGTKQATTTIIVTAAPSPTLTFTASPTAITSGATSTLTWNSTNTTSCVASVDWSGTKAFSASLDVAPTTTKTYVLDCSGLGGSIQATTTVTVSATLALRTASLSFASSENTTPLADTLATAEVNPVTETPVVAIAASESIPDTRDSLRQRITDVIRSHFNHHR